MPRDSSTKRRDSWLPRRAEQATLGVLTLVALLAMLGWWTRQGGWQGRLIEFERMPRQEARFLVDINAADWPEFAQLPGIGETLARRICDSRVRDGDFADHNDLLRVQGIGPRTLDRMKPFLRTMPEASSVAGSR